MSEMIPQQSNQRPVPEDWYGLYDIAKFVGIEAGEVDTAVDDVIDAVSEVLRDGQYHCDSESTSGLWIMPGKHPPVRYLHPMIGSMTIDLLRDEAEWDRHVRDTEWLTVREIADAITEGREPKGFIEGEFTVHPQSALPLTAGTEEQS